MKEWRSSIGKTIHTIGIWTIFLGAVGALICGALFPTETEARPYHMEDSYNWAVAIILVLVSVIGGILLQGIGEAIDHLAGIDENSREQLKHLKLMAENNKEQ